MEIVTLVANVAKPSTTTDCTQNRSPYLAISERTKTSEISNPFRSFVCVCNFRGLETPKSLPPEPYQLMMNSPVVRRSKDARMRVASVGPNDGSICAEIYNANGS